MNPGSEKNHGRHGSSFEDLELYESQLTKLDQERVRLQKKIESFRLSTQKTQENPHDPVSHKNEGRVSLTSSEKVAVFKGLFRGRDEVFPKLWINQNKNKKGYAPACFNEWMPNVCGKPKVKCGECPNQAFIPVDDKVVLDHLQGRHTLGVYPLLTDETCWFLAMDFDKAGWMEDAAAVGETCRREGIPFSLERSRSGNGAHIWFFFGSPVSAGQARKMGCFLITETMSRRHELSMESYDRFFPNQDTMPRGGFGNLIALPLQYEPRKQGNSVFLDQGFSPYPDQWDYLRSVQRLERDRVEAVAAQATREGMVTGVRFAEFSDEESAEPWTRPPSGRTPPVRVKDPLPKEIRVVLSQRLYIDKAGLPAALLNQIKRLAAFQNPEFYKKQSMRLFTAQTPRIITCAEDMPQHVSLPRGSLADLKELMREHHVKVSLEDKRNDGIPLSIRFHGQLTALQTQAADLLLKHDMGVLVAPPGMGKTVLGIHLATVRKRSTLILVHRAPLLDQWVAQLCLFLGIGEKEIGRIGAGKKKPNGNLDVAMMQSLIRKGKVDDVVARYGLVIVDECHHLPAFSFERILSEVKARYVIGLTATPQRRDGLHPIMEMQLGPVRFAMNAKMQAGMRTFSHRLIRRETAFRMENTGVSSPGIQDIYRTLAKDERRNQFILRDVLAALKERRSPILLTERREQLDYFKERLQEHVRHVVVLHGGTTSKKRHETNIKLSEIPAEEERMILATGRFIGEGFDDARLDTLFLAAPISWKGTLTQYTGRLHCLHPGKSEVRIYDYVDAEVPMLLRMFEKRLKTYHALGYTENEMTMESRQEKLMRA